MAEMIFSLVLEVVKCLAPPTERRVGYLRDYNANFENLRAEIEKLKEESTSIQRRVSEAERNGENIEEKVERWVVSVKKIIDEAAKFIQDEETATNKRCLKGLCPNFKTRYQLSKKAETEVKAAIVELREEAGRFDRISYRTIPEEIWLKSRKGYEAFESRLCALKSVQNALTDVNVSIVGVYGMGGIGKTTLVKEVARQAREDKLFDLVVFSEVSQTLDIKKIQQEIAEKLGLVLEEETGSRRASRLYERLKKEEKILIILDNIWKCVDLEAVGIPFGDDHKGCKLLLTARDRNVLFRMGSQKNFSIDILNEEEAWRLFKLMADDHVENRELQSTATEVAQACKGLPIALTTIARALRNKSVPEWKSALQELRMPSEVNFEGVPAEAYSTIELSFKNLKGEQLKKFFMLCSLLGNSICTSYLFQCCMGLGILQKANKLEDARNKLYALVHELRDSCLLLEGDSNQELSMHDVIRDVAISIACRDQHAVLVRNEDVWEWPDDIALKECYAISLRGCSIHELPEGLECPRLEFLHINPKDSVFEINNPCNFFTGMRKLRVVDFTRMQLLLLPSSIDLLVNLQTLCLVECMLDDIAIIGKLKNLEILSFWGSGIVKLPEELGHLTKLRQLDLSNCFKLKVIAPNVISRLVRLEELYMSNCFVEWDDEGPNSERINARLDELMHLPRLTNLEVHVKNDNVLPEGFFARKLERFKISVGDSSFLPLAATNNDCCFKLSWALFAIDDHEIMRTLKLKLNSVSICSKKLQGIKDVEYLCLDKSQDVKNVLFDLDREGFSRLKHLHVQNNPDFMCIVDSKERVPLDDAFPILESLNLYNLIKLERICQDRLSVQSFNELKTIRVELCDQLSNIFLLSAAKCLPRLERIAVINCRNIQEIFVVDGEYDAIDHQKIEFSQLRTLCLGSLPELTSFCCEVKKNREAQGMHETCSNKISSFEDKLDISSALFNEKVVLSNLEVLEMNKVNIEKIWHNQLPVAMFLCFQNLTRLILSKCPKLKYIFSASMLGSFEHLQHLEICHCKGLQEIISKEGADDQVLPNFVFPQVTSLRLSGLPELKCLYPGMHTSEWPALKLLKVSDCDQVTVFDSELFSFCKSSEEDKPDIPARQPLFLLEKIFPNLEELGLDGKGIRMIWHGDFPRHLFGGLKVLQLGFDASAAGFPLGLLERFHHLEELRLKQCLYEEILSNDGHLDQHVGKLAPIKYLRLSRLNNLNQLWKQDSQMDSIFQYVDNVVVSSCDNLLILLPSSSVSFRNLKILEVSGCKKLTNLVASSAAQSLVALVKMQVFGCRAMTQVVKSEGNQLAREEIVFNKLKMLSLLDLDSLTSFCSGNYIFKFPSLEVLFVVGCPKMNIFTTGELSTPPRVDVMYRNRGAPCWDGDLNTTIQQLHRVKLLDGSSSHSNTY
ncbi:disease resistance protein RPS2 isoform X1 [Citrus clementina]|uniref:disease resistance protein RPS2 isoform X1 n=1 Tax=Citrus clementina TaxID=85681 RepID=UPI000CED05EC|nr:disease resistance protein RPS2 isoform X1 [Citrus x clementina]XP_024037301.1 disease resistance protein RPS2 isoform X1 [Citrus x clementina]